MNDDGDSSCPSSPSITAYSCDEGGSDLERYCSANSVLATSSISSSLSHHHTDFLEDSFLSRRIIPSSGQEEDRPNGDHLISADFTYYEGSRVNGLDDQNRSRGLPSLELLNSNSRSDGEDSISGDVHADRSNGTRIRKRTQQFSNLELLSSSNTHSDDDDDDDSISGDCTDFDANLRALNVLNHKHSQNQIKNQKKSSLLMDSSVAFGADDWDEFMMEREDGSGEAAPVYLFEMDSRIVKEKEGKFGFSNGDSNQEQIELPYVKAKEPIFPIPEKLVGEGSQISVTCENIEKKDVDSVNELGVSKSLGVKYKGKEIENQEINLNFSSGDKTGGFEMELKGIKASEDLVLDEANKLGSNDYFEEMVQEMEQILLDSDSNTNNTNPRIQHFRDGSSTASTSGTDDPYQQTNIQNPKNINWVEVIGAKQKKGDVSFGERLVGVKEYTVYILKVKTGTEYWLIERRYRDFYALYKELKSFFIAHGLNLPLIWSNVERESKKVFGNSSPSVIGERSILLQECLRSILSSKYPFKTPTPLIAFLTPNKSKITNTPSDSTKTLVSLSSDSMGKKISLFVEINLQKSIRQLLESQHYKCAGCHGPLGRESTVFEEIVRTVGFSRNSRVCEYTGQLFCTTCHVNDTSVLPARVLHKWDFALYPVSQLAKAYLESIHDQPMLCVSAVNPFLFSKVPALLHIMSLRKKISSMLPYITCPFLKSIEKGLGTRRYLLECNDFFALRDLVDLSKGAFAGLPIMVGTVYKRVLDHITQQCLVCYDAGVPCAARQSCDDPFSLIFPFQESEAEKCSPCGSIYHKNCFAKLNGCTCNKTKIHKMNGPSISSNDESARLTTGPSISNLNTASGFLSDIISKARPDKLFKPRNRNPVILMRSLPGGPYL